MGLYNEIKDSLVTLDPVELPVPIIEKVTKRQQHRIRFKRTLKRFKLTPYPHIHKYRYIDD